MASLEKSCGNSVIDVRRNAIGTTVADFKQRRGRHSYIVMMATVAYLAAPNRCRECVLDCGPIRRNGVSSCASELNCTLYMFVGSSRTYRKLMCSSESSVEIGVSWSKTMAAEFAIASPYALF